MALFGFGDRYAMFDSTPVENLFIQEYMLRAEGEFVKVYLYGLMQCYHPCDSTSLHTMARDLSMEEDRVRNAFSYWERLGLVRRVSDNPISYAYLNLKSGMLMRAQDDDGLYRYADFNQSLQAQFGTERLLHPQDFQKIYDWLEVLKLPEEVVLMLVSHCIRTRGAKFQFRSADKMAQEWADAGIRTISDAEEMLHRSTRAFDEVRQVLRRLGKRHAPSMDDEALYQKWTTDWEFTLDAILAACVETTKGSPTMAYLDAILARQHKLGHHDAQDVTTQLADEREAATPVRELLAALGMKGTAPTEALIATHQKLIQRGFPQGVLLIAARYAARRGGKLDDLERLLDSWQRKGLMTTEAVDSYLQHLQDENARIALLFEACGETRRPTEADRQLLTRWIGYGMVWDVLLLAAEYAASAGNKMAFMDRILSGWQSAGVKTTEDARKEHAQHTAPSTSAPVSPSQAGIARPSREVAEHRYTQRTYTQEELDTLVFDLFPEEGGNPV